ncbi:MAG: MarR family transcriptional regulator [Spirochaetales bacterium]|nr:MarR family transcriptional regulator [Spirochaetales bacterium]
MRDRDTEERCKTALNDFIMAATHTSFRKHFLFFKEKELSHSQIFALHMLRRRGSCTVSAVGDMLSISKPAASQLLDQLVKQGLVERYESPEDRRIRLHRLSDLGASMLLESAKIKYDWSQKLVDELDDDELDAAVTVLELLRTKIPQDDFKCKNCENGDNK